MEHGPALLLTRGRRTGAPTGAAAYISRAVQWSKLSPALIAIAAALALPASAAAQVEPFGAHDAGGFRNVLPPGEAGVENIPQLGTFLTTGGLPPHWDDQQPLYDGLVNASAKPSF